MKEIQTYEVAVTRLVTRKFRVNARTPEEAENVAESLEDDDSLEITNDEVQHVEAFPTEDE